MPQTPIILNTIELAVRCWTCQRWSMVDRRASTPARARAIWEPLGPLLAGPTGDMREQARIARQPNEFAVAARSDYKNTFNVRHSSDILKAVFPFDFTGGMLEVHAKERLNE